MDLSSSLVARQQRARERMAATGTDVLLLSLGADLPYLTGYEAMPLERLTMLVLPRDGVASLVVPGLEAPRVDAVPDAFELRPWSETEDPIAIVAGLVGDAGRVAIGDQTWARFVLALQAARPDARLARGVGGHRAAARRQGRRRDRGAAHGRPRGRRGRRGDAGPTVRGPHRARRPS